VSFVDLDAMPYWTEADKAEYGLLIFEFVEAVRAHQEHCAICSRGPSCAAIRDCFEGILRWRRRRELLSLAAHLRACQDFAEAAA
jgi:hypothetical protein